MLLGKRVIDAFATNQSQKDLAKGENKRIEKANVKVEFKQSKLFGKCNDVKKTAEAVLDTLSELPEDMNKKPPKQST
jgi:hypothetical protein